MNLANRDVGKLASVLIGGTVDQQRISLRTLLLCNLLVSEIHLNTTNLPSGRKTVSGAYLGMTLSCCGATLAHAIGMVFPAFINVKIFWKNRQNPSTLTIDRQHQTCVPRNGIFDGRYNLFHRCAGSVA